MEVVHELDLCLFEDARKEGDNCLEETEDRKHVDRPLRGSPAFRTSELEDVPVELF